MIVSFTVLDGWTENHHQMVAYSVCDIYLLCFSVNNEHSFENIDNIWIKNVAAGAFIIIGCKNDLPRQVSKERAVEYAEKVGATCYFETSALDEYGTRELFEVVVTALRTASQHKKKKHKKCSLQ